MMPLNSKRINTSYSWIITIVLKDFFSISKFDKKYKSRKREQMCEKPLKGHRDKTLKQLLQARTFLNQSSWKRFCYETTDVPYRSMINQLIWINKLYDIHTRDV